MNTTSRLMLIALLAASTVACNKEEEAPQQVEQAPVAAPTGDDLAEWRPYVSDAVTRNMGGITNQQCPTPHELRQRILASPRVAL